MLPKGLDIVMLKFTPLLKEDKNARLNELRLPDSNEGPVEGTPMGTSPSPSPIMELSFWAITWGARGITKLLRKSSALMHKAGGSKKTQEKGLMKNLTAPVMDMHHHLEGSISSIQASPGPHDMGLSLMSPGSSFSLSFSQFLSAFRPPTLLQSEDNRSQEHLFFTSLNSFKNTFEGLAPTTNSVLPQLHTIKAQEDLLIQPVKILVDKCAW